MQIIICSPTFYTITHGPAKFTNIIYDHLINQDEIKFRIITKEKSDTPKTNVISIDAAYPKYIGVLWEYYDNYYYYKRIKEEITDFVPDVIVFIDAITGYYSSIKLKKNIKIVGLINDYEYCEKDLATIEFTKNWLIKYKGHFLEKLAASNMDLILSNSIYLYNSLLKTYKLPSSKMRVLYKSHPHYDYLRHNPQTLSDKTQIKVFFLKNDFERGGLFILIDALGKLNNYNFKLIIGGNYPHKCEEIERYNKSSNVELYIGRFMDRTEVIDWMLTSDIFCVPAFRESLGVANIEALSIGIPVVTTNAGGIPEVTDGEKLAFIAAPGNIDSLSKALLDCIQNDDERLEKTILGKAYVRQKFGSEEMISNFIKYLYDVKSKNE